MLLSMHLIFHRAIAISCTQQPVRTCSLLGADAVPAPAESPSYQLSVGDMELSSDEECMVPLPFIGAPAPAHALPSQQPDAQARVHASSRRSACNLTFM